MKPKADDGTRTHDTWLGKPVLYQLSYVRVPGILAAEPKSASPADAAQRELAPVRIHRFGFPHHSLLLEFFRPALIATP